MMESMLRAFKPLLKFDEKHSADGRHQVALSRAELSLDARRSVETAKAGLRHEGWGKPPAQAKFVVHKRELRWDILAWAAAIAIATLVCDGFGLTSIKFWAVLVVLGLAATLHTGMGLIHGLYWARPYGTLSELGAVLVVVGLTTALLIVLTIGLSPDAVTVSIFGAVIALGLMALPRRIRSINRQPSKRKPRWFVERQISVPLDQALAVAEEIVAGLDKCDATLRGAYGGSVRRMQATVGDVDIVVASERPTEVVDVFLSLGQVYGVWQVRSLERETKVSAVTRNGIRIQLKIVPPGAFGAALLYSTGSRAHTVELRKQALWRRYRFSWGPELRGVIEYWLFLLTNPRRAPSGILELEEDVYARLGMSWIPPTLREGRGEVQAAIKHRLPRVVEMSDICGDLHSHSLGFGGYASTRMMALAAAERGYAYFAITNQGRRLRARGLKLKDIERQSDEVRTLNEELAGRIRILHGVALSIGPDGELDYPDEILQGFDLVIASIHYAMDQEADRVTRRLLLAIEHPRVNIIGHPTGRRIGVGFPYDFDFDAVCQAASRHQVALEVNAHPDRLDLPDDHVRRAKEYGVRFTISTGARAPADLANMRYGVGTAQRGWATPEDVINTWPLEKLKRFLENGTT